MFVWFIVLFIAGAGQARLASAHAALFPGGSPKRRARADQLEHANPGGAFATPRGADVSPRLNGGVAVARLRRAVRHRRRGAV
jgi:hypothetical protein